MSLKEDIWRENREMMRTFPDLEIEEVEYDRTDY